MKAKRKVRGKLGTPHEAFEAMLNILGVPMDKLFKAVFEKLISPGEAFAWLRPKKGDPLEFEVHLKLLADDDIDSPVWKFSIYEMIEDFLEGNDDVDAGHHDRLSAALREQADRIDSFVALQKKVA